MSSALVAPRRNIALVTVDIVISAIPLAFGAVLALTVLGYSSQFGTITADCGAGPFDGIQCNTTALSIPVYRMIAVTIIGSFLGIGTFIVSLIRKRLTFWWPLGAVILILIAFYVASWVASMVAPS